MRWSTIMYSCVCGKTFRTPVSEARHRHNFPLLCKQVKVKPAKKEASK